MILRSYETLYAQETKHRKKCRVCGKAIMDGELVRAELIQKEKYYPVKGIMRFNTWYFSHSKCRKENHATIS